MKKEMNKKMDIVKLVESILDVKLYNYQKELLTKLYNGGKVPQQLIMPRRIK